MQADKPALQISSGPHHNLPAGKERRYVAALPDSEAHERRKEMDQRPKTGSRRNPKPPAVALKWMRGTLICVYVSDGLDGPNACLDCMRSARCRAVVFFYFMAGSAIVDSRGRRSG